jgi:hypothetical protein
LARRTSMRIVLMPEYKQALGFASRAMFNGGLMCP